MRPEEQSSDVAPERITVSVRKYDGSEHRSWQADLIERRDDLIVLEGVFEGEIEHEMMGRITHGTRSVEYYWLDRCYNVFRLTESSGEFRSFYCNINTPPVLLDHVLTYVDLDIDVLVEPDFSYRVIDIDEFEANAEALGYSEEIQRSAMDSLAELISLIEKHQFPFSV
jgi:protein associated with RNAse G/E